MIRSFLMLLVLLLPSATVFAQYNTLDDVPGNTPLANLSVGGVFNAKDYGAEGNGTTDDTIAIQNALNAAEGGGAVLFPPGTYRVTSTLELTKGCSMIVEGVGSRYATHSPVTISFEPGATDDLFDTTWTINDGGYRVLGRIQGLRITGNDNARYAFRFDLPRAMVMASVFIENFQVGVYSQSSLHCVYDGVMIEECDQHCVLLSSDGLTQTTSWFRDCYFREAPILVAIEKLNESHCFTRCYFEACSKLALDISAGITVSIVNCWSEATPLVKATYSDLTINDGSTTVTSAAGGFSTNCRVGDFLSVASTANNGYGDPRQTSPNMQYGYYEILSVDSDTQITVDSSPASGDVTGDGYAWIIDYNSGTIRIGDETDTENGRDPVRYTAGQGAIVTVHGGVLRGCNQYNATGLPIFKCDDVGSLTINGGTYASASGLISSTSNTRYVTVNGSSFTEIPEIELDVDSWTSVNVFGQQSVGPGSWFVEPGVQAWLNSGRDSSVPLTIKAHSLQSANLLDMINSSGDMLLNIDNAATFNSRNIIPLTNNTFSLGDPVNRFNSIYAASTFADAATVNNGLVVNANEGVAGDTRLATNLMPNAFVVKSDSDRIGINKAAPTAQLDMVIGDNAKPVGFRIKAASGQVNSLQDFVSSGDATLLSFTNDGRLAYESSLEDKISLFSNRLGATNMYGFGAESGATYSKAPTFHRFYVNANADNGASDVMEIGSSGVTVEGSITGNSLQTSGDMAAGKVIIGDNTTKQISNGVINYTSSYHLIQPEGDILGDDELTDITGGSAAGEMLVLRCWTNLTGATTGITIRHNAPGNLRLKSDAVLKDSHDTITLLYSGVVWCETARNVE